MKKNPFVLCVTNTVAANFTANVLLAIGATPAMMEEPSEAADLAALADAVLINVGTVTPDQAEVMRAAIASCQAHSKPWVLDPVGAHILAYRQKLTEEFISQKPTLIRGNLNEIHFFQGTVPGLTGSVPLLATGEVDEIWGTVPSSKEPLKVSGGVEMLQTVTATGCAQGAVCAACLGGGLSPVDAALKASRLMKRAGEMAYAKARLPGSFQVALVDALYELTHD